MKTHVSSIGHRNGRVFLRLLTVSKKGRSAVVCPLYPNEAEEIGRILVKLAGRAARAKTANKELRIAP